MPATLPVSLTEFCIVTLITVVGTLVQGSVGFGLAVIAAPLLLLVDPNYVPAAILAPIITLTLLMAWRDRAAVQGGVISIATIGRIVGTIPAAYAVGAMSQSTFDFIFGLMVFGAVLVSATHFHFRPTRLNVFLACIVSGFTGTISSIGGPPLALVYQRESGEAIRGTMSLIFFIGASLSLLGLWWAGQYTPRQMVLSAVLMPGMLLGFFLSRWTVKLLDGGHMRPAVLALSSVAAVMVILRALW